MVFVTVCWLITWTAVCLQKDLKKIPKREKDKMDFRVVHGINISCFVNLKSLDNTGSALNCQPSQTRLGDMVMSLFSLFSSLSLLFSP